MTFARRIINLQFQLGRGSFGQDGSDTIDLKGLRCSANITKAGGVSMSQLELQVWGLSLDVMSKLTILNKLRYSDSRDNRVTVSAGTEADGVAVCFSGTIAEAWADMREQPEAAFHCTAFTGLLDALKPVEPTSYSGTIDVAQAFAGIAQQMVPPRTLENSGVSTRIASPYLAGTLRDQALSLARAANCNMLIDDEVLAIWPLGSSRGSLVVDISPETGLVGYPVFTQNGIQLTTLYNPSLAFGASVNVKSALEPANGRWTVANVSHNLDAEMPGGQWFTRIECGLIGQETPIIG